LVRPIVVHVTLKLRAAIREISPELCNLPNARTLSANPFTPTKPHPTITMAFAWKAAGLTYAPIPSATPEAKY
jgi:hypothetical protein